MIKLNVIIVMYSTYFKESDIIDKKGTWEFLGLMEHFAFLKRDTRNSLIEKDPVMGHKMVSICTRAISSSS